MKRPLAATLWWLVLCLPADVSSAAQPSPWAASTQPATADALAEPPAGLLRTTQGGQPAPGLRFQQTDDMRTAALAYKMLGYTVIILASGGIGFFVVKKLLPKVGYRAGRKVCVLETVYLGPKKTLHLLQVGTRRFLVAGSRDQISLLGEVTGALPEQDAPATAPAKRVGFAAILNRRDGSRPEGEKL